jgi:hypothetical protein
MNTNLVISVVLVAAVLVGLALVIEGIRRLRLKRWQREREACLRQMGERLRGREFAVIIRDRDGHQTSLETDLVGAMTELGAVVCHVPVPAGDAFLRQGQYPVHHVSDDALLMFGQEWEEGGNELNVFKYHHLDLRVLQMSGKVLASASLVTGGEHAWDDLIFEAMERAAAAATEPLHLRTLAA